MSPYPLKYSRFPTFNEHYRPFFVSYTREGLHTHAFSVSMHGDMQKNIKIGAHILNISGFPCLPKKIIDLALLYPTLLEELDTLYIIRYI